MNVLLFGATGMVGQGVMHECLLDPEVQMVRAVGRTATGVQHTKLNEIVHQDLWHYEAISPRLSGFDACFFCLGVSSVGMTEAAYRPTTYNLALGTANTLLKLNQGMTFLYVSGAGTNAASRTMWARVKGETENAVTNIKNPLAQVSKNNYNIILIYEKAALSSRLAYNWRDKYIDSFNQPGIQPTTVWVQPRGQLDFSASYDLAKNLTITVDATNALGNVVNYPAPLALDLCNGTNVFIILQPPSGSIFQIGSNSISCAAVDSSSTKACE